MSAENRWTCLLSGLLILGLVIASPAAAEGPREFLVRNWTRDEGLPGATVTAIAQTADGYLWLGMFAGLVRFDGMQFTPVPLPLPDGVTRNAVLSLRASSDGDLWVGTESGHLLRLRRGEFSSFLPSAKPSDGRGLRQLTEDGDGRVWLANYDGNFGFLSGEGFQVLRDQPNVMLASDSARRVWALAQGQLLTATEGRLQTAWTEVPKEGFRPQAIAAARQGGCWLVAKEAARRFDKGRWQESRPIVRAKEVAMSGVLEDREGNLWVATYGAGLTMINPAGVSRVLDRERGLPTDVVRCLLEDGEGNIWAGLEGKGLVRIRPAMFASYGRTEGLSGDAVLDACEGKGGEIWLATNGDGVQRIKDGRVRRYGRNEGLTNEFAWAVCADRSGRLWAGTWGGGLFQLEGERFRSIGENFGPESVVLAIHEDTAGTLWIGGRTRPERRVFSFQDGRFRSIAVPGDRPLLEVSAIAETPDGSLWFGCGDEGLIRLRGGEFTPMGPAHGLPSRPVNTLGVDDAGNLWVAVGGAGLFLRDDERFLPVGGIPPLLNENLNQITDDGLGYLWCGSRGGVVRLKLAELKTCATGKASQVQWQHFSRADGLPSNECSGSGVRSRDGRVWFPTAAGVAVVDPRRVNFNPRPPAVFLEEVLVSGKLVAPEAVGGSEAALTVPPGAGQLEIHYTGLSFGAPERVRFRYQLRGLDLSPVDAGFNRVAHYGSLAPGRYRFEVTACNEDGAWNELGASLPIIMLPHYWQTWWFQTLAAVLLLAAVVAMARWAATRRLRRRLEILEQQRALEKERLRISQDLHDDLGTSLTEINLLSTVASGPNNSPAEIKEFLGSIGDKSIELVKALDEIVWAVNPRNDSLRNLVNYLCLYAQDFLRPAAIQCRLDVQPVLPELPLNAEQRHTLFLVTKEALANAVKHSAATELSLRVQLHETQLSLAIADNGRGFDRAHLRGGRNGLANIENRMQHLGGRATIRSAPGQGTRVELELPIK